MVSLLGESPVINEEPWFLTMIQDLHIDQILFGIKLSASGYDVVPMYHMYPTGKSDMEYRKMVAKDMRGETLQKGFVDFSREMKQARALEEKAKYADTKEQQWKWHSDAWGHYIRAVGILEKALSEDGICSAGLCRVREKVDEYVKSETYGKAKRLYHQIETFFGTHRFYLSVQPDRLMVKVEEAGDKEETGSAAVPGQAFSGDKLSVLEKAAMLFLKRREPDVFGKMKELMRFSMEECFSKWEEEAQFYLSYFRYIAPFEKNGYLFSMPDESEDIDIRGGFDLALAAKRLREQEPVVPNDFRVSQGERFIVITGPNGGGKTTCARMVGIVLYFSAMGLPVPAAQARLPYYSRILTHFSVEESEKTGKGKLVEELQRLEPILAFDGSSQFVVLNELFTTAATRDAEEMGSRVMKMLMERQCRGIYVTHIQSLAKETGQIVSMIAELCEDHRTRSFKIVRRPAEEDEYEDSMIEKYHMTLPQIQEVLSGEN